MEWWMVQMVTSILGSFTSILDKKVVNGHREGDHSDLLRREIISFVLVALPMALTVLLYEMPSWVLIGRGVLSGGLYMLAVWLYFQWLGREQVTVVTLILRLVTPATAILAYYMLGERLSSIQVGAIVLSLIGAFLMATKVSENLLPPISWRSSSIGIGLCVVTLLALASILNAPTYRALPVSQALAWECIGQILVGAVLLMRIPTAYPPTKRAGTLQLLLVLEQAIRLGLAFLNGLIVAQHVPLAVISSTGLIRTIFVLILAVLLLKERWQPAVILHRLIGAVAILLGFFLLT